MTLKKLTISNKHNTASLTMTSQGVSIRYASNILILDTPTQMREVAEWLLQAAERSDG